MKKSELFKKFLFFQIISFLVLLFVSLTPIIEYKYNYWYYGTIWNDSYNISIFELIIKYDWDFDFGVMFFVFLILITLVANFILIIINSFKVKLYNGFPSIKDAKTYYQELKKVKIAQDKLADKFRIEKAKTEFNNKMAKLEEEKKKYF